jgi:hypothetical protein
MVCLTIPNVYVYLLLKCIPVYRIQDNLHVNPEDIGAGDSESKKSLRPTTARRRPPKVQDGSKEVDAKPAVISTSKATGILVDGHDDVRFIL